MAASCGIVLQCRHERGIGLSDQNAHNASRSAKADSFERAVVTFMPSSRSCRRGDAGCNDTIHRLDAVLTRSEGRQPQESFAARTESCARDGDYVRLLHDLAEHVPGAAALEVDEDVRRVRATEDREAGAFQLLAHELRVLQIVVDEHLDLCKALVIQAGHAALLHDVGGAVEGGGHDAVEVVAHEGSVGELKVFRDDGPAEADAGEASVLGEGVHLNRAVTSARHFKDGLGDTRSANERRVGGVEHQDGALLLAVGDQLRELLHGRRRSGGVVRRAEVDHISALQT
eukprot:scaffold1505_cov256-Pinguiococcus_pyrenoidosus.AAC.13